MLAGPGTPKQMNAALSNLHRQIQNATLALERAKTALCTVPAKVLATELDPNAEAWLALAIALILTVKLVKWAKRWTD